MYILVLYLPLISAVISGLFGRYIGDKGAALLTSLCILSTSLLSWVILFEVSLGNSTTYLSLWSWINTGYFNVSFGLLFDSVTAMMLILITTISFLVHLYSTEYMAGDPHLPRFMSYLSLFTFFMLILVTADNLLQLFIGWEGVGLCSYLLINFWFTRIQANKSAIKAMVVNRIGDVGIAIAIFIGYNIFQSVDFNIINATAHLYSDYYFFLFNVPVHGLSLFGFFLFVGAVGKSAQLGLHTWLPDAMEGPTPVSALIHAATMVTAGVFLLIRSSSVLEYSPDTLFIIVIIGALTAFFAATVGVVQNDIKKVIAYSTCSQLGYMVFACGISNYSTSLFHLINHGFFKALLFLSAGSVIHAMADEQDFRKYGGMITSIPFTYSMMFIGSLSLMGFPFLTGFYSKDAILELAFSNYTVDAQFAHWLGSITAMLTAFYSLRLLYLTFLTQPNSSLHNFRSAQESAWPITFPLLFLAIGSIFIGYLFRDLVIGLGTTLFNTSIFVLPSHLNWIDAEFVTPIWKLFPVILSLFGAFSGYFLYHYMSPFLYRFKVSIMSIYTFFNNKWHFDYLYNQFFVKPSITFGYQVSYKLIDRGLIEFIGPEGLKRFFLNISSFLSQLQSGVIYQYAILIFFFTTLYLSFVGFSSSLYFSSEVLILTPILLWGYSQHSSSKA